MNFIEISYFSESWQNPIYRMVTRAITFLAANTLPLVKIQNSLLPLGSFILPITTLKNGNFFFTTTSRNLSVLSYEMPLITILLWILAQFTKFSESLFVIQYSHVPARTTLQPTYVNLKKHFWKKDTRYISE